MNIKTYNTIKITPIIKTINKKERDSIWDTYYIDFELLIDDEKIANYYIAIHNIIGFLNPDKHPEFSFWTCDCNNLGCASIVEMDLLNNITDKQLKFRLFTPVSYANTPRKNGESTYLAWSRIKKPRLITVDKEQLKEELAHLIIKIEILLKNTSEKSIFLGYGVGYSEYDSTKSQIDIRDIIQDRIEKYEASIQKIKRTI